MEKNTGKVREFCQSRKVGTLFIECHASSITEVNQDIYVSRVDCLNYLDASGINN